MSEEVNIRDKTIQAKCNTGDLGMRNKEKHELHDMVLFRLFQHCNADI